MLILYTQYKHDRLKLAVPIGSIWIIWLDISDVYGRAEPTWHKQKVDVLSFLMCCRQSLLSPCMTGSGVSLDQAAPGPTEIGCPQGGGS
jgi:hypothetical protein